MRLLVPLARPAVCGGLLRVSLGGYGCQPPHGLRSIPNRNCDRVCPHTYTDTQAGSGVVGHSTASNRRLTKKASIASSIASSSASLLSDAASKHSTIRHRIKVAVRIRPLLPEDIKRVFIEESTASIATPGAALPGGQEVYLCRDLYPERRYVMDWVLGDSTKQIEAFDTVAKPVLDDVFLGFNGTVLCYGQTGSGKTHTMFGKCPKWTASGDDLYADGGLVPQSALDIFTRARANESSECPSMTTISVTFTELYMEKVYDLLARSHSSSMHVREDPSTGVFVEGLTEVCVSTCDQLLTVIAQGVKRRVCHATGSNAQSSRSHAILTIHIEQQQQTTSTSRSSDGTVEVSVKRSSITFVDLAGSERVSKTGTKGVRLEEAKAINKSVSALGNCVAALAENAKSGKAGHVPLRDSVLTRLLSRALTGDSKTVLCVNLSPCAADYDETYSTLLFGTRAMEIVTTPTLRVTQEVSDAILTRKATPDVVIPTPIPTMRRGSVRDDDDDEDEEDTSCGTSSQRVTLPVSALPWKTTVPTSSSGCSSRLEQERLELMSLLAGTRTGAALVTHHPLSNAESERVAWLQREAELAGKYGGIIRHLETLVTEQNLTIAKLEMQSRK